MRVPQMGGTPPSPVTKLEPDELTHSWPQFLSDGRHLLYRASRKGGTSAAIYVQEVGSSQRVRVLNTETRAMWSPPGYLLFMREGNLFAQRMNPKTFQLEGEPFEVAEEVRNNEGNGRSTFAISQNGVLVYRSGVANRQRQLSWRDRAGKVLSAVGKPGLFVGVVTLSPDERSAALITDSPYNLWILDLVSGVLSPMTRDGNVSPHGLPVWSPDSQRVAIRVSDTGLVSITLASGKTALLTKEPVFAEGWSPDSRSILSRDAAGTRLSLVSLAGGSKVEPVVTTPYRQGSLSFSPDGRYVVYSSYEAGGSEIYVASFPSFALKKRVSEGGGSFPVWARGGKEIFYRASDRTLTAVDIRTGADIVLGDRKPLFKFGIGAAGNRFAVSADGQRFLINEYVEQASAPKTVTETPELTVVINWSAEMKQ